MAPATRSKKTTSVDVKDGLATVYVHKTVGSIFLGDRTISRGAPVDERTWSFTCSPEEARDVIERYEFCSGSAAGVALTVDERRALEDLKSRSNVEVAKMASALASLAENKVREDEAAQGGL